MSHARAGLAPAQNSAPSAPLAYLVASASARSPPLICEWAGRRAARAQAALYLVPRKRSFAGSLGRTGSETDPEGMTRRLGDAYVLPSMATHSDLYKAPFAPGGSNAIDARTAEKLLAVALSGGGDYADLFFEYRAAGGFVFDEGILKSASRGVSMGLGVRVLKGDATGYAYVEELDWNAMKRAAETAAQIASGGGAKAPIAAKALSPIPSRYELDRVTLDVPGMDKRRLLERAAGEAHAFDKRIAKVEASLGEEIREILVVTSDGRMAHDVQPLVRFGVRVIAEENGKRQEGSSGGGGRTTLGYFEGKSPEWHARTAAEQALRMLEAEEAPAGTMEVVLAPGDSGILLHEAVGHGLEADFNRKGTSNYSGKIGSVVASELCTVIDDATLLMSRGSINVDDEGNEPKSSVLIEKGKLVGYMHDRHSAGFFKRDPSGNGRRESFACAPMPRMTNTILTAGPHDPAEILKSVKRGSTRASSAADRSTSRTATSSSRSPRAT